MLRLFLLFTVQNRDLRQGHVTLSIASLCLALTAESRASHSAHRRGMHHLLAKTFPAEVSISLQFHFVFCFHCSTVNGIVYYDAYKLLSVPSTYKFQRSYNCRAIYSRFMVCAPIAAQNEIISSQQLSMCQPLL